MEADKGTDAAEPRNLYLVQDSDRPMYVLAKDWADASNIWSQRMCVENAFEEGEDLEPPLGIQLIAQADEIIVGERPTSKSVDDVKGARPHRPLERGWDGLKVGGLEIERVHDSRWIASGGGCAEVGTSADEAVFKLLHFIRKTERWKIAQEMVQPHLLYNPERQYVVEKDRPTDGKDA